MRGRMGNNTRALRPSLLKFLTVGVLNAGVDLLVLNLLFYIGPTQDLGLLVTYNTLAVFCAIVNSYVWNKRWTFRAQSDGSTRERVYFVMQSLLNVVVNDGVMYGLSAAMLHTRMAADVWEANAAKGVSMFAASSLSFFCMRFFVFRNRDASRTPVPKSF